MKEEKDVKAALFPPPFLSAEALAKADHGGGGFERRRETGGGAADANDSDAIVEKAPDAGCRPGLDERYKRILGSSGEANGASIARGD